MKAIVSFSVVRLTVVTILFIAVQSIIFITLHSMYSEKTILAPNQRQKRLQRKFHHRMHLDIGSYVGTGEAPSLRYEKTRRRLRLVVEDLGYFLENEMKKLREGVAMDHVDAIRRSIDSIASRGAEYERNLLRGVTKLSKVDGYNKWRFQEASDLSDLVQRRLQFLQNPKYCHAAKKLVCRIREGCGFGCQVHHLVYCLLTAYSSQRTMILDSEYWNYDRRGWESVFQPLSDTCRDAVVKRRTYWTGFNDTSQVVHMRSVEAGARLRFKHHPYLPRSVPEDLAPRITKIHEEPALWWIGQMIKYLMRLNPRKNKMVIATSSELGFKRPIVGVHIRRSDKLMHEASFHRAEEYMYHVGEFYERLSLFKQVKTKRIYLATDDIRAFDEIQEKYPEYVIVGQPLISQTATGKRYTRASLNGLIVDLHLLANSDFLVCTFSSNVCRLAYEMMQSLQPDAAGRFRSLDDPYYYSEGGIHRVVAQMSHKASPEFQLDLENGDVLRTFYNLWNGSSIGYNFRTNKKGLYPSYKVDELVEAVDFPSSYPQVPLRSSGISEDILPQIEDYY